MNVFVVDMKAGTRLVQCYYKNLDSIQINNFKIWDVTLTISKLCLFFLDGKDRFECIGYKKTHNNKNFILN